MADADYKPYFEPMNSALGAPGFAATYGGLTGGKDMLNNLLFATNPATGLPLDLTGGGVMNELARPLGLNWSGDPIVNPNNPFADLTPAAVEGAPAAAAGAGGAETAAAVEGAGAAGSEGGAAAAAAGETSILGAAGGALGILGGGASLLSGIQRFAHGTGDGGTEQDMWHGGGDIIGGTAGIIGGAASLATGLGATAASAGLAGTLAAAAPVAAPVAAAIGLAISGDHYGEDRGFFGTERNADGSQVIGPNGKPVNRGAFEAAWDTGQNAGTAVDNALGGGTLGLAAGALTAGVSTVGLEAGAAVADVGLGFESLGASSGMFGTATDGNGATHNRGAFEAMDSLATDAGHGVDDLLGLDQHSTAGKVVSGITEGVIDVAEAPLALAADVAGGIVGGVGALLSW